MSALSTRSTASCCSVIVPWLHQRGRMLAETVLDGVYNSVMGVASLPHSLSGLGKGCAMRKKNATEWCASEGDIYVSDGYGNRRVARFRRDGTFISEWGGAGRGPGKFKTPHGLALGPDGRISVADRGHARIQVFSPEGAFLSEWKGPELGRPRPRAR
ncbi:hypothetical protein F0U61_36260 [Archangium violaceum]|uniref:hypothetical protein n=1 Tax=Archangium violaceum TaxID=83451 RepID=UPI002B2DF653|nr:hypothetical protein F0U61_36260 [Archangium violaceum]